MLNDTETRVINHQSYVTETVYTGHATRGRRAPSALSIHAQVLIWASVFSSITCQDRVS